MLAQLTAWATPSLGGLLAMGVLMVLTGRLVPISTLRREVAAANKVADLHAARADKASEQLDAALAALKTTEATLRALGQAAEQRRR